MRLTVSKRFEFSASHRYFLSGLSDEENLVKFGLKAKGAYGHGHNYVVHFIFSGEADRKTGMLVDIARIKRDILPMLAEKYDHKYLNQDNRHFFDTLSTPENIARQLLKDAAPLFDDIPADLYACHLKETESCEAVAYTDGKLERILNIGFSAARRTYSPNLTDDENKKLFGRASSVEGHGHHYRLAVFLENEKLSDGMVVADVDSQPVLEMIFEKFDHKNLNTEVAYLIGKPVTTEIIARYIFDLLKDKLPVKKIRLNENDNFYVEYSPDENYIMGVRQSFFASHRLHSKQLSDSENYDAYDKCNNLHGHGHQYKVDCAIRGRLVEKSGILYNLAELNLILNDILSQWNYKHLDLETGDFTDKPSTGENIIAILWKKLEMKLLTKLYRLELRETNNNRFMIVKND